MQKQSPHDLDPPGIQDVKRVDSHEKWRRFVPTEHRDQICPKPPLEALDKIKKERNEKSKTHSDKKQQKKPAATHHASMIA